jgi:signal transduction histidine kinase
MFVSYKPERSVVVALLLLQTVGMLGVSLIVVGGPWAATTSIIFGATLLTLGALLLYLRGLDWARLLAVATLTVIGGLFLPEPFVTSYAPVAVLLVPALALVLADVAWVLGVATLQYLILVARADFSGVYTDALTIAFYTMIVGALVIARLMTDMARARAEEQSRLLEEERASLERRVAERTGELASANDELRQANQLRDLFLASVSHELRTPLNIILGGAELLREEVYGELNPRQHQAIDTVAESGRQLLHLINDILDLAKMESGRFEIEREPVSVRELCEQCGQMIAPTAARKGLSFALQIEEGELLVCGDYRRLRQILLNLLSNALKFTHSGGIGLEVRRTECERQIELAVWDTGIGIEPDRIPQLFKPFAQLDSGLARQYEGSGLGLALVEQLVARHQGDVGATSAPGRGSRFWVRLPAA